MNGYIDHIGYWWIISRDQYQDGDHLAIGLRLLACGDVEVTDLGVTANHLDMLGYGVSEHSKEMVRALGFSVDDSGIRTVVSFDHLGETIRRAHTALAILVRAAEAEGIVR